MQVHDDESLANDIGTEPCIDGGDTMGEASAGECSQMIIGKLSERGG